MENVLVMGKDDESRSKQTQVHYGERERERVEKTMDDGDG